jgi:peptidase E
VTADTPTILATCGGLDPGTWSDAIYGPLLEYAIELSGVAGRAPRVAHINTAGGDQRFIEGQELEAARLTGVEASHLRFFPKRNVDDIAAYLLSQDVIWVSGGSLVNLLAVWHAHALPGLLEQAWRSGVVLAGGSAGALCWHSGGTTQSYGPAVQTIADGLAFLPWSLAVHWDSDAGRRPSYLAAIADGTVGAGFALEEGTGIRYSDQQPVEFVSQSAGRRVWRVARNADGTVSETAIEPRILSAAGIFAP